MSLQVGRGWRSTQARLAGNPGFLLAQLFPTKGDDPQILGIFHGVRRGKVRDGVVGPVFEAPQNQTWRPTQAGGSRPCLCVGAVVRSSGAAGPGVELVSTCTPVRRAGHEPPARWWVSSAVRGAGSRFRGAHSSLCRLNRPEALFVGFAADCVQRCDVKMARVPERPDLSDGGQPLISVAVALL